MSSSSIKGFLCSQDGTYNFPLMPKLTTIGRENCEILINNNSLDLQHAVIEYVEDDGTFLLHDLNTVNGTYVNDCRIQNAAVRLTENDMIRFGFNGTSFQLVYQSHATTIQPNNINHLHRQSQNFQQQQQQPPQPLQIINQTLPSRGFTLFNNSQQQQQQPANIWATSTTPNASLITIHNQPQFTCPPSNNNNNINTNKPLPATLRSRPVSAGGFTNPVALASINNKRVFKEQSNRTNNNNSWGFKTGSANGYVVDSETYRQQTNNNNDDENINIGIGTNFEQEIRSKINEIKELKEKIAFLQSQVNTTNEMEQVKRDKSIAVGLVNTMQKDLTTKDLTISKLAREIEGYKRELKERDQAYTKLEEKLNAAIDDKLREKELNAKETELNNIKNILKFTETKVADLTKQMLDLKVELDESKRLIQKHVQLERQARDELEHSKNQYIDMQRCERTVRIDLEQMKRTYDKFRNQIIQSVYSTPGITNPSTSQETTDEDILNAWKQIIDDRIKHVKQINDLKQNVKKQEDNLKHNEDVKIKLNKVKEYLVANLTDTKTVYGQDMHAKLKELNVDTSNSDCIHKILELVKQKLDQYLSQTSSLELKIKENQDLHEKKLQEELDRKNKEFKMYLDNNQSDLNDKHVNEIDVIRKEHSKFVSLIQNDYTQKVDQLNLEAAKSLCKIDELSTEINQMRNDLASAQELSSKYSIVNERKEQFEAELNQLRLDLEVSRSQENKLQTDIDLYRSKLNELNSIDENYQKNLNEATQNYKVELSIHKEQTKQHSLTIVNFEKELSQMKEKEKSYLKQIEALDKLLKEYKSNRPTTPPKPSTPPSTAAAQTIDSFKSECLSYKTRLSEQDDLIKTLKRDLAGASAKLSDCHGEMTEKQKRELERTKQLVGDQQKELSNTRAQLARLSEIVDKQTKQLDTIRPDLAKSKALVDKYRQASEENGQLAVELKSKLEDVELQLKKYDNIKKEEGKITSELTAVGAQCRGERHEQVINRQREALNELRQRIKNLEQTRPSVPSSQQQMQQQIMLLKKQLAEVRASQALTDDIAKHANLARGQEEGFLMIEEKTAHYETQTALEQSEESFLTMLRSFGSLLDVNELDGLRSMGNLPHDERVKLNMERAKSIETLCNRIKYLQDSLSRKEQVLKEYEIDLAKLRQAEFLLEKKSEQVDENQLNIRNRDDEIEYLKESLKNAKTELEREKLLNTAIKQKKNITISTDRARKQSTDTLHHHCPPTDELKTKQLKKDMNDKLKRKEYELKTLKTEIKEKTDELYNLSNRYTPK